MNTKEFIAYLIYEILYQAIVLGGCGYAVFVLGHSGWWFALAIILSLNSVTPKPSK